MSLRGIYVAAGFTGLTFAITVDAVMGYGAAQWLVDLCLTGVDETDMADMNMERDIRPGWLIGLSLSATGASFGSLLYSDWARKAGRILPTTKEQREILSAICLIARQSGGVTAEEIESVYQIVTGDVLESDLALHLEARTKGRSDEDLEVMRLSKIDDVLARRRIIAAAMLTQRLARIDTKEATRAFNQICRDIEAGGEDLRAARASVVTWSKHCPEYGGRALVAPQRHRRLGLTPA